MPGSASLPFTIKRSHDVVGREVTSTKETIHGLVHLDGERLVFQWRVERQTDIVGREIRSDREVEPVREVSVPIAALARATVRTGRWLWSRAPGLVLTAADLQAFDQVAGEAGLRLGHPAEIILPLGRDDVSAARAFATELELVLAERGLRAAEDSGAS